MPSQKMELHTNLATIPCRKPGPKTTKQQSKHTAVTRQHTDNPHKTQCDYSYQQQPGP